MGSRQRFESALAEELAAVRRRVLVRSLPADHPTLGDVLECLDDGAYPLDQDDPITIGDLVAGRGVGPRVVDVLVERGLPLDSPMDVATQDDLAVPLRSLLPTIDG